MIKLILFDFDGTIEDNSEGIFNCIKYALKKKDTPCPPVEVLRKFVGPTLTDSYKKYIKNDTVAAEKFINDYRERYAPTGHKECVLYPGIKSTLKNLKADGYTLALCSAKPLKFVAEMVKILGVEEFFSELFCPGLANRSSDKTALILDAVTYFGVKKSQTLMVGDTVFDIDAAKAAGVRSVGVTYGFSEPGELQKAGADILAFSPEMLYNEITSQKTCVIFGAGEYGTKKPVLPKNSFVIAADGGYKKCLEYNIKPDMLIGDFDSFRTKSTSFDCDFIKLPTEKDVTDTDAAVSQALQKGCKSFVFYGCTGGRPDHTIANVSLLKRLSQNGIKACMHGKDCTFTAITNGVLPLKAKKRGYVSVFSLSAESKGVFEQGLKYSLDNAVLTDTFALGISNEFTGNDVYIKVENGTLLITY